MITPRLFENLDPDERKLWHSHVFEVKSGMAIMPAPAGVPQAVWELAETKEMEEIIPLYGKTYHFWQVDRGDPLPLGQPQLMMSFTEETKPPNWKELMKDRDEKFHVDSQAKSEKRKYIKEPKIHPGMSPTLTKCLLEIMNECLHVFPLLVDADNVFSE